MKHFKLELLVLAFLAVSCATPQNIAYFQDAQSGENQYNVAPTMIRLLPEDKISIIVNCKDMELTNLFNLPYVTRYLGQVSPTYSASNQGVSGYTLDADGNIDFPMLGTIHIEGMTRGEVADYIKAQLIANELVKDAVVTVDYLNLSYSVFGEVNNAGRFNIQKDCTTILDALATAGDLTIYGIRENVTLLRRENGVQKTYSINLCSAADVTSSPAYFIKQNDIIYVQPNEVRTRQSTVNGNNVRSTSFWISLASLATSVSLLFIK